MVEIVLEVQERGETAHLRMLREAPQCMFLHAFQRAQQQVEAQVSAFGCR